MRQPLDDRGRPVDLLDWNELDPTSPRQADLRRLIESVVADPTADARSLASGTAGCLVKCGLAVALGLMLYTICRLAGMPMRPSWFSVFILWFILPLLRIPADRFIDRITGRFVGRNRADRITDHALGHWTCPGCGYSLEALEVQADGCRVCPECGAAWRETRIQKLVESTRPKPVQPP